MIMRYIRRAMEETFLLLSKEFPALLLTGPGPWSVDAWCMDIVHVIFG